MLGGGRRRCGASLTDDNDADGQKDKSKCASYLSTVPKHKELLRIAKRLNEENNTNEMEAAILIDLHTWDYWVVEGKICTIIRVQVLFLERI